MVVARSRSSGLMPLANRELARIQGGLDLRFGCPLAEGRAGFAAAFVLLFLS